MSEKIHGYSLKDAEALPVFMEPQHDQLIVAPVKTDSTIIETFDTFGADSQCVYLVVAAGPGRMRADGERVPMDFVVGDLIHMSGRQLLTAFAYRGYFVYMVTAQSVAAKVNREKFFDVLERAKAGEFQPKKKKTEDKLEKKYGSSGEKPKIEVASG